MQNMNLFMQVSRQGFMDAAVAAAVVLELLEKVQKDESISASTARLRGYVEGALNAISPMSHSRGVCSS